MANMNVKRLITPQDKIVARNLRRYFNLRKSQEGLTQSELAEKIGIKQPSVSQMLSDPPTLAVRSAHTLAKLANALRVRPDDLDPRVKFSSLIEEEERPVKDLVDLRGLPSNRKSTKLLENSTLTTIYGIHLNNTYEPTLQTSSVLIIDQNGRLRKNKMIVVQDKRTEEFLVCTLKDISASAVTVEPIQNADEINKRRARRKQPKYLSGETKIPMADIAKLHAVLGIEF